MCLFNKKRITNYVFYDNKTNIDINNRYDIAIVLGCHIYELMMKRVETVLYLYKKHIVTKIYLTGGVGVLSKNRNTTEASVMKEYLVNNNVNPNDIIVEDKSTTTKENISNIMKLINNQSSIIVVTSEFHCKRVVSLLNNTNHNVYYYGVSDGVYDKDNWYLTLKGRRMIKKEMFLLKNV